MEYKYKKYKTKYLALQGEYSLHVSDPWLYYIQLGIKTVEGRKGPISKYSDWIGKKVYFYNQDRKIPVEITTIRKYNNLVDYINSEKIKNIAPQFDNIDQVISAYHQFYSDSDISQNGMLALQIKLL